MRYRTLYRPENVKIINDLMVPVSVIVTDIGYPNHLPIFLKYESYSRNPWPHFRSSHMAIVNAEATRIYASTGSQLIESSILGGGFSDSGPALKKGLARFSLEKILLARIKNGDKKALSELQEMRAQIEAELEFIMIPLRKDVRLMTAHFLQDKGPDSWPAYLTRYAFPKKGSPDVIGEKLRSLTTFTLGEFISDDHPFSEESIPYLKVIYNDIPTAEALEILADIKQKISAGKNPTRKIEAADFPVPPSLRKRAAKALVQVYGLKFANAQDELENARLWWQENRARFIPPPPVINDMAFGPTSPIKGPQH